MPVIQVTVLVEQDGVPMPDFSIVRRLTVDGVVPFDVTLPALMISTVAVPGSWDPIQVVLVRPLNQATIATLIPGSVTINPGGFVLVFDATLSSVTMINETASPTEVQGLTGGVSDF